MRQQQPQALSFAAQGLVAGEYDIVIACGVESMSRVPIGSAALADGARVDVGGPAVAARYPGGLIPQGISAESADHVKAGGTANATIIERLDG
ncbi:hypothetical protein O7614_22660 [Micromonospora sp. WMMD961]|uniref:thiolase family protein n=1 Tax=Micromonospora sp. WMMD961 TaxID=3016100 RepID=UPI0024178DC6|nr:hypothetical protein [Micromonospora sp. WMMD961]MDG4782467.1 hypothetical protein [Micromonospora sp. WMMD961]